MSRVEGSDSSTGGPLASFTTRSLLAEDSIFAAVGCADVLLRNVDELFSADAAVEGDASEAWSCFRFLDFACSKEAAGTETCDE